VFYKNSLVNIRHRLINAADGDKYRPHRKGLGLWIFNDAVLKHCERVVIVEGEKKTIVMHANGIDAVGIPGMSTFRSEWAPLFENHKRVWIALDPGAEKRAAIVAQAIGPNAYVCTFPTKPDDFFFKFGATLTEFREVLRHARPPG
jgi:DNA primase